MALSPYIKARTTPIIRYIGDSETGIVHAATCSCDYHHTESFLDLRTAIVRGYRLCLRCTGRA